MDEREFQFEWDEAKATANLRKHDISFELASSVFGDPRLVTVADLEHSELEERWFSIGFAANGTLLSIVYLMSEKQKSMVRVRLISARKATAAEIGHYQEGL